MEVIEREQAEAELQAAKEAAEVANRAKSAFRANVSHKLRTLLDAIIGYSEMLIEDAQNLGQQNFTPGVVHFRYDRMLLANLNQAAKAEKRGVLVCEGIFFISQSIAHVRRSRCDVKVMETETFRSVISKVAYFSVYPFLTVICLLAVNFDEKW